MNYTKIFNKNALVNFASKCSQSKSLHCYSKKKLHNIINDNFKDKNKLSCDTSLYPKIKTRHSKKGEWLSNFDIEEVMDYYQKRFKTFVFLGALSIDFQETTEIYRNFSINNIPKDKIGIIFNTAKSTENGKHWISVFISKTEKTICVFDSNGNKPQYQLVNFINKINKNKDYVIFVNKKIKQITDGTCGLFAINFILERITGKSCNDIYDDTTFNDNKMECIRSKLFQ